MPPPLQALTFSVEPTDAGQLLFLHMAPSEQSRVDRGQVNVYLRLTNHLATALHVTSVQLRVLPQAKSLGFITDLTIAGGASREWTQPGDLLFDMPGSTELEITIRADGQPAFVRKLPMRAHVSPTDGYRFWGAVHDLRPGEYWHVHGSAHGQTNSAQLFAYDVSLGVADPNSPMGNTHLLPGGVSERNEDHRIWGKQIYSVSEGTVTDFRNDFPTNEVAGVIDPEIEKFWTPVAEGGDGHDGNGNFFVISGDSESILYAHMQPGSLNRELLRRGATVHKGDFLGLVGNTGSSGGPHLHIHSNVQNAGPNFWIGEPRPMTFRNAHAVGWIAVKGDAPSMPWVKLAQRGFPAGDCAVWPSDRSPAELHEVKARHLAINTDGQAWVIAKGTSWVHTTSERLPARGLLFDLHPQGSGSQIAVFGDKPYVIGDNGRLWEGLPDGWVQVDGSPPLRHVAIDSSNGRLWVIDTDARVWSRPPNGNWVPHPGDKRAAHLCVSAGVPYIAIANDNTIWRSVGVNGWVPLGGTGKAKRLAANPSDGRLWAIGLNDNVYSYNGTDRWRLHGRQIRATALALHAGIPYVIADEDEIYKSEGSYGWLRLSTVATRK